VLGLSLYCGNLLSSSGGRFLSTVDLRWQCGQFRFSLGERLLFFVPSMLAFPRLGSGFVQICRRDALWQPRNSLFTDATGLALLEVVTEFLCRMPLK
jgi:hypothetical protein